MYAPLQAAVSLSGTILLHGNIDRVELWNPDRFRASVEKVADADRETLAQFKNRLLL